LKFQQRERSHSASSRDKESALRNANAKKRKRESNKIEYCDVQMPNTLSYYDSEANLHAQLKGIFMTY
jgi:hypothetical protein